MIEGEQHLFINYN